MKLLGYTDPCWAEEDVKMGELGIQKTQGEGTFPVYIGELDDQWHFCIITKNSYTVTHSLECRATGEMETCIFHKLVADTLSFHYYAPGKYKLAIVEDSLEFRRSLKK